MPARTGFRLYLLRHGDAEPFTTTRSDAERALTPAGIAELEQVAQALVRLGLHPDVILTSPLRRAVQTAEIVATALQATDRLHQVEALGGGCRLSDLRRLVAQWEDCSSFLLVGHEPDFSTMVGELIGGGAVDMKKAGLAYVKAAATPGAEPLGPGTGVLIWLLTPRVLLDAAGRAPEA